jgi:hypothetical protein
LDGAGLGLEAGARTLCPALEFHFCGFRVDQKTPRRWSSAYASAASFVGVSAARYPILWARRQEGIGP